MKKILLLAACLMCGLFSFSQSDIEVQHDALEVRFIKGTKQYDLVSQQYLRSQSAWQGFLQVHGTWYVHFNEATGLPHRAYGAPISMVQDTPEAMALSFAQDHLAMYNLPLAELVPYIAQPKGKYQWANFSQMHEGHKVLGGKYTVKFSANKVILFGCELYSGINISMEAALNAQQAVDAASANIAETITSTQTDALTAILPVPSGHANTYHLVYEVYVKTVSETNVPSHYYTLVDAHTGTILYRQNMVAHHSGCTHAGCTRAHHKPEPKPAPALSIVSANITGTVYPFNPYNATEVQGLANTYITVGGEDYPVGLDGTGTIAVTPGSSGQVRLMGPWSRVYTAGVTPSMSVTLQDGANDISFDNNSNIKERCAYKGVNEIHDFMKFWMPDFDGMDYQLTTNVDEDGECNAFYDGASINFYDIGGGCNATSLVADVIYHEYGHGINDYYYQSEGGNFQNGAMGEGYADYWGVSCTDNPNLGVGFYTDNENPLREYDAEPMVYPVDLVGEVHNDGEIIMGAWWDSHVLMGADWNVTMPLFVETYAGLQAETFNGNEGEAYTDVLIDLLQADDDDADITNGTPNGAAIVEGFLIHGITLISNAALSHDETLFVNANTALELETQLELDFPFSQYLGAVQCHYRINGGAWQAEEMTGDVSDNYTLELDAQPAGTVVAYYFSASDLYDNTGNSIPIGAHINPFPNLPYYTLCGVEVIKVHDGDDNNQFGAWTAGIASDNATTGEWEQDDPIPSYTVDTAPGTMVQPGNQHTPGGEICFFTGNATSEDAGIGENDVDGGKTTLQSPTIDMTLYDDPIIAYWRWYTNNPPGGANPGQDYWQVRISNNNGSSWTYVENTRAAELAWRRNAFRVSDVIAPTAQMRFQFIASDSTWLGQNLDGGSLIEAAMDDFVLYDSFEVGVQEHDGSNSLSIFPNPAATEVTLNCATCEGIEQVTVTNSTGQVVVLEQKLISTIAPGVVRIDISALAAGSYTASVSSAGIMHSATFVKR